ncbi:Scr1 family TA system antitoxin-like transcriptional regulator [Streptomyces sp. NPDC086023]|uniref:helix-turn-helix domain-containing protein n=1 Tax=Streptomyces sp. NPDC086023 TaxID=3365746 RepID=UPI0037D0765F
MANGDGEYEVEPDPALRAFGEVVKAFRKRAGYTQEQFAPLVDYSVQSVGSFEQGRRFPQERFVNNAEEVLDGFGAIRAAAKHLMKNKGLASWLQPWAQLEERAVSLSAYDCRAVPGLLQTEAYARAVAESVPPPGTAEEVNSLVAARLERQRLLSRTPLIAFSFVVEQALIERRTGGSEVTGELIDRMLAIGSQTNVELQIMPLVSPDHAGANGPMVLMETEENRWLAYCEGQRSGLVVTEPKEVSILHQRYAKLRSQALNHVDSVSLLKRMRGAL